MVTYLHFTWQSLSDADFPPVPVIVAQLMVYPGRVVISCVMMHQDVDQGGLFHQGPPNFFP